MQGPVVIEAELELRIRDDDALGGREGRGLHVQPQGDITDTRGHVCANGLHDMLEIDVLVMQAELGLRSRRKDRLRQLARLLQSGRQAYPAHGARGLVILPARADQVAARNRLDQNGLKALDHHGSADDLIALVRRHDILRAYARGMVGQHVGEFVEPEIGQFLEYLPLAGDRIVQDDVEGRDAIRGDNEQLVVANGVHVAHLAARKQRQGLDAGLQERGGHVWPAYCTTCESLPAAYSAAMTDSATGLILLALPAVPNCS